MPVVNPGIRRYIGSAIQRLFNSASFSAPLTHSLTLERGTGSPTFTRATTGTVMGYGPTDNEADGQKLLTVASGEARFTGARRISEGVWSDTFADGSPIPTATLKGYLAEPAATNLCLQSQTLGTAPWVNGGTAPTTTADAGVAPDGTSTADRVAFPAASSWRYQNITLVSGNTYTISGFAKSFDGTNQTFRFSVTDFTQNSADLTATSAWQRFSYTFTTASSSAQAFGVRNSVANAAADILFFGLQLELGSSATSYIPTTTTAVARNADVDSLPTAGNILAAAGTIALTYTPTSAPSGTRFLWGTYVDASNYTAILHDATNLIFRKRIAGTNYDATIANAFVSGTTYKMAATWGASGTGIALNGTLGTGHANTTAAQIGTAMQTGADGNGANQPGMSLGNVRIGQRQLSNSELQAITR